MTINKKKEKEKVINYGPWARFAPTENSGFAWFPFDCINWLSSPDVNRMIKSEQGVYIQSLATQWVYGSLSTDPADFARQIKCDLRTAKSFLGKWGKVVFTCLKHPNGGVNCDFGSNWGVISKSKNLGDMLQPCDNLAAELQQSGNKVAADMLPHSSNVAAELQHSSNKVAATLQQKCSTCVNGKLHFLALNKGKLTLTGSLEERREEKMREEESENIPYSFNQSQSYSSSSSNSTEYYTEGDDDDDELL